MDKHQNNGVGTLNGSGASRDTNATGGWSSDTAVRHTTGGGADFVRQLLVPVPVFTRETAFEHGRDVALSAGDMEVNEKTVSSLTEYCRAMAREMKRGRFDPVNNSHDKLRQEEYDALREERKVAKHALSLADGKTRDAKHAASVAAAAPRTEVARWAVAAAVAGLLALGFVPTIHDLFFDAAEPLAGWYGSVLTALALGVSLSALLLWLDAHSEDDERLLSRKGLWAGVGIAFAFCAARWRDADGLGSVLFSFALFIYEAAVVLLVETVLASVRKAKRLREARAAEGHRLESEAAAHGEHGDSLKRKIAELDAGIEAFINYVEQRNGGEAHTEQIEQGLISAALNGYNAGIMVNRGKVLGA